MIIYALPPQSSSRFHTVKNLDQIICNDIKMIYTVRIYHDFIVEACIRSEKKIYFLFLSSFSYHFIFSI